MTIRVFAAATIALMLVACSDQGTNTSDPVNNTPASGPVPAPADADPTPQTGSGGQSPVVEPSGNEKRQ